MTPDGTPCLSIVIPAFNEAHRLPGSLKIIADFCKPLPFSHEVLVIVEKSTDNTLQLALEAVKGNPVFEIVDNKVHRGKGYAVRTGMLRAKGEIIFYMDADLSVPLEDITVFQTYFEQHPEVDVLVGNRQHAQSRIIKSQNILRQHMGQNFNRLIQCLVPLKIKDTQCGFKAFRQPCAREIFSRQTLDGFAFDVEALLLAQLAGYNLVDLPVQWSNSTESKVHIVYDSIRMLRDAIKLRRSASIMLRRKSAMQRVDAS